MTLIISYSIKSTLKELDSVIEELMARTFHVNNEGKMSEEWLSKIYKIDHENTKMTLGVTN